MENRLDVLSMSAGSIPLPARVQRSPYLYGFSMLSSLTGRLWLKPIFIGLFVLLFGWFLLEPAVSAGEPLELGDAVQHVTDRGYFYVIPVKAQVDGFSTMRAVYKGDPKFVKDVEGEVAIDEHGTPYLALLTPKHYGSKELYVFVQYQGLENVKFYELVSPQSVENDPDALPTKCEEQWVIRGTLVSNIERILGVCHHIFGLWPLQTDGLVVDYVVQRSVKLAGLGGLESLLSYVESVYGFGSRVVGDNVVDFYDHGGQ